MAAASNKELLNFPPLLESVRSILPRDLAVFLVGGAVRDALLGRISHDLDFAVERDGIKTARQVANALKADFYPLDPERDTGRVIVSSQDGARTFMDFATFRGADLRADLTGRDFTINAIALDIHSMVLTDPLGGGQDLRDKQVRACSPSAFLDDPVRILRAVRQAAEFGFRILSETKNQMKQAAVEIGRVAPERLRDEIFRILEGLQPAASIQVLETIGVLKYVLPEVSALQGVGQSPPHVQDVWTHTLSVMRHLEAILAALDENYQVDSAADLFHGLLVMRLGRYRQKFGEHFRQALNVNRSQRGLFFFAALFHDIGKPESRSVRADGQVRFIGHDKRGAEITLERARLLSMSRDEMERLGAIIRNHMRIHYLVDAQIKEQRQPSRRSIYRFFRVAGPAGVDLILLALADCRATYENTLSQETWLAYLDVCRLLLENWWEKPEESVMPPALINGNELMAALHLPPGPLLGSLLEAIREGQAAGKIKTQEEAIAFAREYTGKEDPSQA